MDFKTVISSLVNDFDRRRIRYGLMGGFALGLWGVARATVDLDFLVRREDMAQITERMGGLGYECKFQSENVSQFVSPLKLFGEVDFLHAFRQASLEMLKRAEEKDIFNGELHIRVLMPEDLIGLKLQAIKNNPSRKEGDMADIKALASARKGKLDWPLIRSYADILEAGELLAELGEE
ncbi:MAG: hypothetical protein A2X56_03505 [Nitrospirae bacterium GWC2_57_13]|jgi:hypothetical protein|nr:MAG: hypothetical protein A2072_08620 [Nitrospirae bacterium GWC1_57_7]OGW28293.1 MAG: hypothetical protein A2X56_03505 [Nitrospirae bacterium GWC2_57_13]OGW40636.1 MAG: hypothetical protein A2X57_03480 [Nitrospirae bacterium GWD2_57_8]HAS54208.1 hypothetical protein [Nitrospiraceae bacterium]